MAKHADLSSVATWLPLCNCALAYKRKPQSNKTTFKAAGTLQPAKTQMKDEALTVVLERILYTERISAVAETGLQTSLTERPQANQRGMIAAQLLSVIPTGLEASGSLSHRQQSDLAARLAKLAMHKAT